MTSSAQNQLDNFELGLLLLRWYCLSCTQKLAVSLA